MHDLREIIYTMKLTLKRYMRETKAAIAILFALMAPLVVGAVGMGLDFAHAYLVRERLTHALDAAALAATASAAEGSDLAQRLENFFNANYPPEALGATYDLDFVVEGDDIRVSAKARYHTSFLRLIGFDEIDVDAVTIVRREVRGLEVALVLDLTGSMAGSKINALKTATLNFIDIIFNRVTDERFLKVGLVPYSVTVNPGEEVARNFVDVDIPGRGDVGYDDDDPTQWQGCVMAREYPHDTLDTSVADGGEWKPFWWEHTAGDPANNLWDADQGGSLNLPYGQCNERRTPNLGCPVNNPIIPLTNDEDRLVAAANDIVYWCRGGTLGNVGMSWGWRVLSPEEPFTQGASYESQYWRKAVVMMTDGENQLWRKPGISAASDYSSYGYIDEGVLGTTSRGAGVNIVNERFAETCEAMKRKGITIYTVTFGSSIIGKPSEEYYIQCASDETKYYPAATEQELIEAFEKISRELSNLHIRG